MPEIRSTTILAVSHRGATVFAGDGQVTVQNAIMKHGAKKIRPLRDGAVLAGFAGSAADSITLFERFEAKLNEHGGQLARAAVELAKEWRTDRYLRRLEAMMIVGDSTALYLVSGGGEVLQPDDGILAIGSGGNFALAAARGLIRGAGDSVDARAVASTAMSIAAELCPFTNDNIYIEEVRGE
ncbi:MAG: ATP-dependent protease subunit HslV [Bdellovibrionales bacterium]|nr:ATP-dependent protease subunit HslV [Bdellovibrionales bacterium]